MGPLLALVPMAAFAAVVGALRRRLPGLGRRETLLVAITLWAAWLTLGTEILSLFGGLTLGPVVGWWLAGLLLALSFVARGPGAASTAPAVAGLTRIESVLLATLVVTFGLTLATAILYPPNTHDALSYHLPRSVRFIQQKSVAAFETRDIQQVQMPPFAEYLDLHAMLLTGGDALVPFARWAFFAASALGLSVLAATLGGGRGAQLATAALFATVPMAVLQASGAKNDLMVCCWAVVAIWALLRRDREAAGVPASALALVSGMALGLLALTKHTGLFLALPIACLAAAHGLRKGTGFAPRHLVLLFLVAFALPLPHYLRCAVLLGRPLVVVARSEGRPGLANEVAGPAVLASNLVRNVAMNLALPSRTWNGIVQGATRRALAILGADADDPRTTWGGAFAVRYDAANESRTTAPVHAVLLGLALLWAPFATRRPDGRIWCLAGVVVSGGLLFCLALKWQPFHARLQMPVLALALPLLAPAWSRAARFAMPVALLALAVALPAAVANQRRPLAEDLVRRWRHGEPWPSRAERLMAPEPALRGPLDAVLRHVRSLQPRVVAFDFEPPFPEYLVMHGLLRDRQGLEFVVAEPLYAEARRGQPPTW